jgi:hypothetical protein
MRAIGVVKGACVVVRKMYQVARECQQIVELDRTRTYTKTTTDCHHAIATYYKNYSVPVTLTCSVPRACWIFCRHCSTIEGDDASEDIANERVRVLLANAGRLLENAFAADDSMRMDATTTRRLYCLMKHNTDKSCTSVCKAALWSVEMTR